MDTTREDMGLIFVILPEQTVSGVYIIYSLIDYSLTVVVTPYCVCVICLQAMLVILGQDRVDYSVC